MSVEHAQEKAATRPQHEAQSEAQHDDDALVQRFLEVRQFSRRIAQPLSAEDSAIQSMEDASPTRWHLAHTTWFFETFLLKRFSDYSPLDDRFEHLFNSYYNTVGQQFPRGKRGLISRPGLEETRRYREHVDDELVGRFQHRPLTTDERSVLQIGIQHEQQHQELMLTDLKHALSINPLGPSYLPQSVDSPQPAHPLEWARFEHGMTEIGYQGDSFSFDNERPAHRVFLQPFEIATRTTTNREYLAFIESGGYQEPSHWLSAGWHTVTDQNWQAPLYWFRQDGEWYEFTLAGPQPLDLEGPVSHISYFEADAFARWSGCRLATEFEWEHAVTSQLQQSISADQAGWWCDQPIQQGRSVHPRRSTGQSTETDSAELPRFNDGLTDAMGNLWEWTSSHYSAYPGYAAPAGALGEYNGKFMCNVFVLKGGSCASPSGHVRPTYRNFFSPSSRWQFTGIRMARSE